MKTVKPLKKRKGDTLKVQSRGNIDTKNQRDRIITHQKKERGREGGADQGNGGEREQDLLPHHLIQQIHLMKTTRGEREQNTTPMRSHVRDHMTTSLVTIKGIRVITAARHMIGADRHMTRANVTKSRHMTGSLQVRGRTKNQDVGAHQDESHMTGHMIGERDTAIILPVLVKRRVKFSKGN